MTEKWDDPIDWAMTVAKLPLTGFIRQWANKTELEFSYQELQLVCLRVPNKALMDDVPCLNAFRKALAEYWGASELAIVVRIGHRQTATIVDVAKNAKSSMATQEWR